MSGTDGPSAAAHDALTAPIPSTLYERFFSIWSHEPMVFGKQVPDKSLLRDVNKRLMRTGTQTKVTATVQGGYVTLAGVLQYENQRRILIRAANQVPGVRQVFDRMTVEPKRRVQ